MGWLVLSWLVPRSRSWSAESVVLINNPLSKQQSGFQCAFTKVGWFVIFQCPVDQQGLWPHSFFPDKELNQVKTSRDPLVLTLRMLQGWCQGWEFPVTLYPWGHHGVKCVPSTWIGCSLIEPCQGRVLACSPRRTFTGGQGSQLFGGSQ